MPEIHIRKNGPIHPEIRGIRSSGIEMTAAFESIENPGGG